MISTKTKHIIIDTPCSASDIENIFHAVANAGHWHDAIVKVENDKIVIEFEYE